MSIEDQLFPLIFVTLLMSVVLPSAIIIPNVNAPISDLTSVFGLSIGSNGLPYQSTASSTNTTNVQAQTAQHVSCLASIGIGAGGGALVGAIFGGIGAIPGAIGGAIVGGVTGCLALPAAAPQVSTSFGNSVIGSLKSIGVATGLGDFMQAIITLLSFVGAIFSFFPDFFKYSVALIGTDPIVGLAMTAVLSYTALLASVYGIKLARGVGLI